MLPSIDDKKYATDSRLFQDAVIQDNFFKSFTTSPVMDGVEIKDICIYKPGDLNKIGKEGRTSWDSFSYAIMMGHNVWQHINSVQEANRQYDAGLCPTMLVQEKFDRLYFKDVVDAIFSATDRATADAVIENFSKFWMAIPGTRGATGKKTINASTNFSKFFEEDSATADTDDTDSEEFGEDAIHKLDDLENEVK